MNLDARELQADLAVGGRRHRYYSLPALAKRTARDISRLPFCLKVFLENVVRQHAARSDRAQDIAAILRFAEDAGSGGEIRFVPMRVMMDDTAGLPLIGDLAAMRDALARRGEDPRRIDPVVPVDFIVDHSIVAEQTARSSSLATNMALEFARNKERFTFLRWATQAFSNVTVVPPGHGICHQINLEHLAQVVRRHAADDGEWLVPDSMVGIDSHTPMINSLGIVGFGVSGIQGVSVALGEPISMRLPQVLGIRLTGRLRPGIMATDLVLTLTQLLRDRELGGAFVEYFGPGLAHLSLPERATVANMTPECGATMSYFPIDAMTLRYLHVTGRSAAHVAIVEAYARAQGLWHDAAVCGAYYSRTLEVDLASIEPSLAGPNQPHQRTGLSDARAAFEAAFPPPAQGVVKVDAPVGHGDVVIAAITSCTNTSNPTGMIGAGVLARNAAARGLKSKPWVKTSLSPGSRVVADYLVRTGLQQDLDMLGFNVAGFGCMTCVGFSGSLADRIATALGADKLAAAAVISGNRNYAGRVHPLVSATFLASPPLVVAYALAGTMLTDLARQPIGVDRAGSPVYLQDIWPDPEEVEAIIAGAVDAPLFARSYASLYEGSAQWRSLAYPRGPLFSWDAASTFIRCPPDFHDARVGQRSEDLIGTRILAIYGDMVTTEHVSPMGPIPANSLAARHLESIGVPLQDLGTYAARRLVAEVMLRATFSSPHLENAMVAGVGGYTLHSPSGSRMTIFDAACRYRESGTSLVVIAGKRYGTGSSRDWSAKGPRMLGVKAVIAESFERLHRANLVAAGVLPLCFAAAKPTHSFTGAETLHITGVTDMRAPRAQLTCRVLSPSGTEETLGLVACLETPQEVEHFRAGGTYRYLLMRRATTQGRAQ